MIIALQQIEIRLHHILVGDLVQVILAALSFEII
jgi:hypothetical protein